MAERSMTAGAFLDSFSITGEMKQSLFSGWVELRNVGFCLWGHCGVHRVTVIPRRRWQQPCTVGWPPSTSVSQGSNQAFLNSKQLAVGSQHKHQNPHTTLLDWTGFRPQHRKPRVQRPPIPTHCAWGPFRMIVLKLLYLGENHLWSRKARGLSWVIYSVSLENAKGLGWVSCGHDFLSCVWAVPLPKIQFTNLKAGSRESTGWRLAKGKILIKFITKISSAALFWTSGVM